ncbi:TrkH family potassium uptake protein [Clostridium formicaceticum]|uniref:Cation transporter n=1 Tax=Clostridium formicaceticum TaxID=1497 RepID=A0AAC9RNU1_9CLOT|nr:TrkH family potassium uptake protein [Clostridium formicaceticum]AOY77948.1 cation transporter [Clostridium formicaceticum]ARE88570.1 Trk system potassium uptake protein TrkG [Clostridium formicaceticum]
MLYLKILKEKYSMIIGYVGIILIGLGITLLLPLLILPAYPQEIDTAKYFLISAVITVAIGFIASRRLKAEKTTNLTFQEGGIIVILSWFITALLSTLPFILAGMLNFTQATFETVSGWTTTGLSVVDVTEAPNTFLLWRSIMQFFGGAGISVVMVSAIIGPNGQGLYNAEGRTDKLLPNVRKSTKLIMTIYSGYVISATLLYILAGMHWFDAINHAIAALSTGGFSTRTDSIGAYNSPLIEALTIVFMLLGTTNFGVHFLLLKGEFKSVLRNGEVRILGFLLALTIPVVAIGALLPLYGTLTKSFRITAFELISALSTTGFSTVGYQAWATSAVFIMIVLMIIGGGVGSTAGGLKLYRVYLLFKSLWWELKGYLLPSKSVRQNYVWRSEGKYYVEQSHIIQTANFAMIYMLTYAIGVLIFLFYGYPLKESMFEFASSLSTVGLSMGITSPDAPIGILWTQIIGMMLGRLEFIVIFFASIKLMKDIRFMFLAKRKTSS